MMTFLTYEYKVAVALLVFYLFYRFLLKNAPAVHHHDS